MPGPSAPTVQPHELRHKDGSLWARGFMQGDVMTGYWEWFRKDGVRMRSGHFEHGEQVGEWTTYDKTGAVYKVTVKKPKASKPLSGPGSPSPSARCPPRPSRRPGAPPRARRGTAPASGCCGC